MSVDVRRQPCTGGEPPFCCQPPMTSEERAAIDARIAAARQRAADSTPAACPECGAPDPICTFDPVDRFECTANGHSFEVQR